MRDQKARLYDLWKHNNPRHAWALECLSDAQERRRLLDNFQVRGGRFAEETMIYLWQVAERMEASNK